MGAFFTNILDTQVGNTQRDPDATEFLDTVLNSSPGTTAMPGVFKQTIFLEPGDYTYVVHPITPRECPIEKPFPLSLKVGGCCGEQPEIFGKLRILDSSGKDVTDDVTAGICVDSPTVTAQAPAVVQGLPISWNSPGVPDQTKPWEATYNVPSSGVQRITATAGIDPCKKELPSVDVFGCPPDPSHPGWCSKTGITCEQAESYMIVFFILSWCAAWIAMMVFSQVGLLSLPSDILQFNGEKLALSKETAAAGAAHIATAQAITEMMKFYSLAFWLLTLVFALIWAYFTFIWQQCCQRTTCRLVGDVAWAWMWIGIFVAASSALANGVVIYPILSSMMHTTHTSPAALLFAALLTLLATVTLIGISQQGCALPKFLSWPPNRPLRQRVMMD